MSSDPNRPEKVYPGNLSTFERLRQEAEEGQHESKMEQHAATIAAQLAGLAYILDGIRYSLRDKN